MVFRESYRRWGELGGYHPATRRVSDGLAGEVLDSQANSDYLHLAAGAALAVDHGAPVAGAHSCSKPEFSGSLHFADSVGVMHGNVSLVNSLFDNTYSHRGERSISRRVGRSQRDDVRAQLEIGQNELVRLFRRIGDYINW